MSYHGRPTTAIDPKRVVRTVGLGAGVVLLFALPFPTLISPDLRRVLLGVGVVVGLIGYLAELRRPVLPLRITGSVSLTVCVAAASAWTSQHPSTAFFGLWLSAAYGGIALLAWRRLAAGTSDRPVLLIALGGVLLVAGSFLLSVALAWAEWIASGMSVADLPLRPGGAGGIVPGPIWTSDFLALLAPVALLAIARLWPTRARPLQLALVGLVLTAILVAAVRAMWVGFVVVYAAVALVWAWRYRGTIRWTRGRAGAGLAVVGVVVAVGLVALTPRLSILLRDVDEGRIAAFAAAVGIARDHPLLGAGPGSYGTLRMAYPADATSQLTLPDPHNGILAAAAETGLLGIGASVLITALLAWQILRPGSDREPGIITAAALGLGVVLAHRMVDMVFVLPGMMIGAILVVGLALPRRLGPSTSPAARMLVASMMLIALVSTAVALPRFIQVEMAMDRYRAAAVAWAAGDEAAARRGALDALVGAPDLVPAGQLLTLAALREGRLPDAVAAARDVAARERSPQNLMRLAFALDADAQRGEALSILHELRERGSDDPSIALNTVVLGTASDVEAALERLLVVEPEAAAFGTALEQVARGSFDRAVDGAHVRLLSSGLTGQSFRLALAADRPDLAEASATAMTAQEGALARTVIGAWSGEAHAIDQLDRVAVATPVSADHWAYLVAVRTCDAESAERWAGVIRIRTGSLPSVMTAIGPSSALDRSLEPERYPAWVWGVAPLRPAFPDEMWTIERQVGVTCLR